MERSVMVRCRAVMAALPSDVLATAVMADDDPLITACLPHPAVIACIHGTAGEGQVSDAEEWLMTRPEVQRRAALLTDRLLTDLARYDDEGLPGWVGAHWSAVVRCPWAYGLDDAVAEGEAFFALV